MTTIRFDRKEHTNHLVAEGHQAGAAAGENMYCAAISAMCCTLINALAHETLAAAPTVLQSDGYIAVSALRTPRTDAFFDMLMAGAEAMREKYPDRVSVFRNGEWGMGNGE